MSRLTLTFHRAKFLFGGCSYKSLFFTSLVLGVGVASILPASIRFWNPTPSLSPITVIEQQEQPTQLSQPDSPKDNLDYPEDHPKNESFVTLIQRIVFK